MAYERDIKRLVKEKDRLKNIKNGIGKGFFEAIGASCNRTSETVGKLIQEAIEKLHEAELILREYN